MLIFGDKSRSEDVVCCTSRLFVSLFSVFGSQPQTNPPLDSAIIRQLRGYGDDAGRVRNSAVRLRSKGLNLVVNTNVMKGARET